MAATLNYSIDRTDRIILLNKELSSLNIEFKKPDINLSQAKFSIEDNKKIKSIRFGLGAIKGVGIKSMLNLVKEREKNGKFTDIIDFMNRLNGDVINKRQIEKLIQAGSFDSIETNRAKLFFNVPKFVEIYGGSDFKDQNQSMLFEEKKLSFDDTNLFNQKIENWSPGFLLKNELEVIGFYFSSHPVSLYPKNYFRLNNIIEWNQIKSNEDIKSAKIVGSILDIKDRSNKEGRKYAFLTISTLESQIELTIFSDKLNDFRYLIKEGNLLLFYIDISRDIENTRLIIKKIEDFEKVFSKQKKIINIYLQQHFEINHIEKLFKKSNLKNDKLYLYVNKDDKLISFDFSNKFEVTSYKYLDKLFDAKKIDYSLEIV